MGAEKFGQEANLEIHFEKDINFHKFWILNVTIGTHQTLTSTPPSIPIDASQPPTSTTQSPKPNPSIPQENLNPTLILTGAKFHFQSNS